MTFFPFLIFLASSSCLVTLCFSLLFSSLLSFSFFSSCLSFLSFVFVFSSFLFYKCLASVARMRSVKYYVLYMRGSHSLVASGIL